MDDAASLDPNGQTTTERGAFLLDHFELLRPPGDVYYLDHIPFLLRGEDLAIIIGGTLLLTLGATRVAARRAAAIAPLEALRTPG